MFEKQGYSFVNAQKYTFFVVTFSGAILSQSGSRATEKIKSGMISHTVSVLVSTSILSQIYTCQR